MSDKRRIERALTASLKTIDSLTAAKASLESSIQEMLDSIGDVDGTMEAWLIGQKALRPTPQESL